MEPRNPELEQSVADSLSDEAFAVYGDWLQSQGDPRGEVIALEAAGRSDQALALLRKHASSWKLPKDGQVEWRHGFVRSAWLPCPRAVPDRDLRRLLNSSACRFLAELDLTCSPPNLGLQGGPDHRAVQAVAETGPHRALRRLSILRTRGEDSPITFEQERTSLAELWGALPNLEDFTIQAGGVEVGALVAPRLRSLTIKTHRVTRSMTKSLAQGQAPLSRISLSFGCDHNLRSSMAAKEKNTVQPGSTVDVLRPILEGQAFEELRELALCEVIFSNQVLKVLTEGPLLEKLTILDLSDGTVTDSGARLLLEHQGRLAGLNTLVLDGNFITASVLSNLRTVFKGRLQAQGQRLAGEQEYDDAYQDEGGDGDGDEYYDDIME